MRDLLRPNIANLSPYRSARNEFSGKADVYLDANENWRTFVGMGEVNRYPDPQATLVRKALEEVLDLPFERTVIGNGSDELIDNLYRCFCRPAKDSVLLLPPTYGAYRVFADINEVKVRTVPLTPDFQIDLTSVLDFLKKEKLQRTAESRLKLLFLCSPNNPTGNAYPLSAIEEILNAFDGIVVVDEAYFDFSRQKSAVTLLSKYPNLVVLRTLSKCWALAGARIGIAVADPQIISVLCSMKYPYNVGSPSQELALQALSKAEEVRKALKGIIEERKRLAEEFTKLPCVEKVHPSDANFLLVKVKDAASLYRHLASRSIIVRNRSGELHCSNCLRITVGSQAENNALLVAMKEWKDA